MNKNNAGVGHNSENAIDQEVDRAKNDKPLDNSGGISGERLRSFIQRIEHLNEDKKAVSDDILSIYTEIKSVGFDTKIIRQIVKLRQQPVETRRENEELLGLYKSAIGME